MMNYARKPGGLRSMRRIPVALTPEESSALHWLQHFAREDQLPRKFRPLRKLALHKIIKALSAADFLSLVKYYGAATATPVTPTP